MKKKMIQVRKSYNMSRKDLADKLGVSQVYIWQIECCKRRLSYTFACKISEVFNTTPDFLFYEDYKNESNSSF